MIKVLELRRRRKYRTCRFGANGSASTAKPQAAAPPAKEFDKQLTWVGQTASSHDEANWHVLVLPRPLAHINNSPGAEREPSSARRSQIGMRATTNQQLRAAEFSACADASCWHRPQT